MRQHAAWWGLVAAAIVLVGSAADRPAGLPPGVTAILRGHQEATLVAGRLWAHWLGREQPIGFCLDVPIDRDTSRWRAAIRVAGASDAPPFEAPTHEAGTSLCFERSLPAELGASDRLEICPEVVDGWSGERFRVPCFGAHWTPDARGFEAALTAARKLIAMGATGAQDAYIGALDDLAATTEAQGFRLLALRLRLVAVHFLSSAPGNEAAAEIDRRLGALPPWLDQPAAAVQAATELYMRADVAASRGNLHEAFALLGDAEELARRVVAKERLAIARKQAEILRHRGAGLGAGARLEAMLDDCANIPCSPRQQAAGHGLLAWFLLTEPDADAELLAAARRHLDIQSRLAPATGDPYDAANLAINRALLARLRGRDPDAHLSAARRLVARDPGRSDLAVLAAWADIIEGLAALDRGAPGDPSAACRRALEGTPPARAEAWAWSCLGQAHRRRSELDAASHAFGRSLLAHQRAAVAPSDLVRVAPGQWADDVYRAARVAIERERPGRAWQLLEALDLVGMASDAACPQPGSDEHVGLEARRRDLRARLEAIDRPLPHRRRRQLDGLGAALRQALAHVERQLLAACPDATWLRPRSADVRAFALADEIVLLRRDAAGGLVARRTPFERVALRRRLEAIASAQARGRLDDRSWRALAAPLATALAPETPTAPVTRYSLHGLLQAVPLAALPLADAGDARWLGQRTIVVRQPPLIRAPGPATAGPPLFVVDPRRDLASGPAAVVGYRARFPRARLLVGDHATRGRVLAAVAGAELLHVDAHGRFDAAFPALSGMALADDWMTVTDLLAAGRLPRWINVSGCATGGSAESGDSGLDGLAGILARHGAEWVVASRSAAADRLLAAFNRGFYRRLAAGSDLPTAFGTALAELRAAHPAAAWSNLILIGAERAGHGENPPAAGL